MNKDIDAPELDRIFHCLGDPSRRRIMALLREAEPLKVGDIAQVFEMTLNGVSKHLKVLEQAGLVKRHVEGREHWIQADWLGLDLAYRWIHVHYHYWGQRLDALADLAHDLPIPQEGDSVDD